MTRRQTIAHAVLLAVLLVTYGSLMPLVPKTIQATLYVPLNLALAATLLWWATRHARLTSMDLGIEHARLARATRWGLVVGLAIAVPLFVMLIIVAPSDPRLEDLTPAAAAYRAIVRIPLGTALFEELAFRSVLLGLFVRGLGMWPGLLATSAAFALWHMVPTLELFSAAEMANLAGWWVYLAYVLALLATFVGGLLFGWLRLRAGHVSAPWVVHALINSSALVGAYLGKQMG